MWKIEKEGQPTSYLFGTIHQIENEYFYFPPHLIELIKNCDTLVMELDGVPKPEESLSWIELDSGSVSDYFTPDEMKIILNFFDKKLHISNQMFQTVFSPMKPFLILQYINQSYFSMTARSYDLEIMKLAKTYQKTIIGLETTYEQLSFFENLPNRGLEELIIESIENYDDNLSDTKKLQKYYHKQNIKKLTKYLLEESNSIDIFYENLLVKRNLKWINQLTPLLKKHTLFIAVGAGHLFYDTGLIKLLESKGYKCKAIKL